MKVLVTGCCGYIGSVLCPFLLSKGYEVIGIDNFFYKNQSSLLSMSHPNFRFINFDVKWLDYLYSDAVSKADVVIPLAALVGVPVCDMNPKKAEDTNDLSIWHLMKMLSFDQRVIFPNTNSGYGVGADGICTEESPLNPISLYGKTKCYAEKYVLSHPNAVSLRLATVCGVSPRMRFDLLVNNFTATLFHTRKIAMYEGHYKRNYVHIMDVARAFEFMISNPRFNGAYNLGHPDANFSKIELAEKICDYLYINKDTAILHSEGKDPDQRNYVISNDKILSTGFTFENTVESAIKQVSGICNFFTMEEIHKMGNA